jgi:DNA helicase-2/ATP-dependent DNA helicase PcrA
VTGSTHVSGLLDALDPEQREVAEALRGPVRVLAGAGTGKTRAITHRVAHGVAQGIYAPTEVLAVTFTTRAAGEMRGRLHRLGAPGVQARTFHSAALRQLRWFWPTTYGGELPTLTESKLPLLAGAARRLRIQTDQALLRDLASEVEWAKVSNVGPDDYARVAERRGRAVAGLDHETVGRLFAGYEEVKRSQSRMDMEDVLLLTAGMLAEEERVAAQVRAQYKWFVVDEFQDVSPIQSALLDLWLGGRDEICVVGDPAQTIYSFAGADASYLRDFPRKFPGTTSVELSRNYRSTPQVVEAANAVLAGSGSTSVRLRAQRPSGPQVRYAPAPDEVAEADAVADAIGALMNAGTPASEIAVLFRINAQSEAFEEALASRGLPYVVRGAARFFDRPEVKQAVTLLRGAIRTDDGSATVPDLVRATLAGMGWSTEAPTTRGQTRDRWESLQALMTMAEESAGLPPADFLADLDRRAAEQHAPAAGGVTLATLHAAKGLEWDAVFLAGMHDGAMPLTHATTVAEIEEERRLLYVGMTRAREHLVLSWAAARTPGGRGNRQPSRFLQGLLPAEARAASAKPRQRRAVHCRECGKPLATAAEKKRGRCGDCPASYDEELFERLRAWRKERADAESVPAFVVFTDATLQLIAEQRPTSPAALLRISGVGPAKLERYGEGVLEVVR